MRGPTKQRSLCGSLHKAYELIGYKVKPNCDAMISRRGYRNALRDDLVASFQSTFPERIKIVRGSKRRKPMLLIDGTIVCAVTVCPSLDRKSTRLNSSH